jgi:RNA-dependent RNA polymerase
MTDGCGYISGAALTTIMRVMKYSSRPTAVQGRIAGAKGMWVLHPDPVHQVQAPTGGRVEKTASMCVSGPK